MAGARREQSSDDRRRRRWQLGALLVCVGALAAVLTTLATSGSTSELKPGRPVPGATQTLALLRGIHQEGTALGDPRAPVTLVEFGDLQCPTCASFATGALPSIIATFVRGGRVRFVFFASDAIGRDSARAALIAYALAAQNRMFEFIELAYRNQGLENSGYVTDTYLRALTSAIPGVDLGAALAARDASGARAQLAQARLDAARLHVQGTPTFFFSRGGSAPRRFAPEGLDAGSFRGAIERLLAGARG
jgi:protein-disulfide isomerase